MSSSQYFAHNSRLTSYFPNIIFRKLPRLNLQKNAIYATVAVVIVMPLKMSQTHGLRLMTLSKINYWLYYIVYSFKPHFFLVLCKLSPSSYPLLQNSVTAAPLVQLVSSHSSDIFVNFYTIHDRKVIFLISLLKFKEPEIPRFCFLKISPWIKLLNSSPFNSNKYLFLLKLEWP